MKILHLLTSNRYSGAENVVCQIISMFKSDSNFEMVYCSPDGQIREALLERGIKFIPIPKLNKKQLKKIIKDEKIDVVHAHDMRASFLAARACKKERLISHIHNNAYDSRKVNIKSIAYFFAAKKAEQIIWVSNSSFTGYKFHNAFKAKSTILYNVIDVSKLYDKMNVDNKQYAYDLTFVGRLTYQKNPERLVSILSLLKLKMPNVKFAVVGAGDLEHSTKEFSNKMGAQDNINFLGFMENPLKLLHCSKAMLMTSRWEGTPMCALESLALGVPVVSTAVDGLREIISQGESGFLYDDDAAIVDALYNIITNSEMHSRMSQKAIELSRRYNDLAKYKKTLLDIYERREV